MTDPRAVLAAITARADAAFDEVIRVCSVTGQWRMSIPANPQRDSDLLLTAALDDNERMVAALTAVLDLQLRDWPREYPDDIESMRARTYNKALTDARTVITAALTAEQPR